MVGVVLAISLLRLSSFLFHLLTHWIKECYSLKLMEKIIIIIFFPTMMSFFNKIFKGIYSPPYFMFLAWILRYPPVVNRHFLLLYVKSQTELQSKLFCLNITYIPLSSINSKILKSCHALLLV